MSDSKVEQSADDKYGPYKGWIYSAIRALAEEERQKKERDENE